MHASERSISTTDGSDSKLTVAMGNRLFTTTRLIWDGFAHWHSKLTVTHRILLILSLLFGGVAISTLNSVSSRSFLYGASIGIVVVCLLPWLLTLRRLISRRPFKPASAWMKTTAGLLWAALLAFPVLSGLYLSWTQITEPPADGWASLEEFVGFAAIATISCSASYVLGALAFAIQIWRDQWHQRLTATVGTYLLGIFIGYCYLMSR